MKKSYILCITITFCILGCMNPKVKYNYEPFDPEHKIIQKILKAAEAELSDKSVIVFTSSYEKDTVKIISADQVISSKIVVTTAPDTGLSGFKGVSNEENIKIQILTPEFHEIMLKRSDLKKYKFVYIYRHSEKRNKFRLEYSNKWKGFQ